MKLKISGLFYSAPGKGRFVGVPQCVPLYG
jgi:hypothetical protein